MPAAAPIAINDGKSTPVTHTFTPSKVSDLVATYYGPGLTFAGREQLVITRREATDSVAGKVNLKLTLPTEVTIDGVTTVNFQDLGSIDIVLASKSQSGDRKDARILLSNLLINTQVASIIDNGEGVY